MISKGPSILRLASFVNGSPFRPDDFSAEGYPVVRIRQLLDESAEFDLAQPPQRPVFVNTGDLIFSWSATLAARIWDRGPALLNQHLFRVDVHDGVDLRWFRYVLEVGVDLLKPLMHGSAMTHLTQEMLRSLTVRPEPLATQRSIADYLDTETARIDALIAKKQRMIELLEIRAAAALDDRLAGLLRSRAPLVPLRHVLRERDRRAAGTEPVLSVYRDYGVIPKDSREDNFNKTPDDLSNYKIVRKGDVVVNKMKAWQGSLGVANDYGIVSGDYLVCESIRTDVSQAYLHHLLRSPMLVAEYGVRSSGIRPSQWRLYWDDFASIRIPVPPAADQAELAEALEREYRVTRSLLGAVQGTIDLLREHRQALITAAVTGELEIPGVAA